jgi:subtilisin family serine protease
VPGQIIVRVKDDTVANVPDLGTLSVATVRNLQMPESIHAPLDMLRRRRQIRDVEPIFSRRRMSAHAAAAQATVRVSRTESFAMAFAQSIRESESEQLRGITLIHLTKTADAEKVVKELNAASGIEYAHRVPARWLAAGGAAPQPDPLVNRQWGLRAIRWFEANRPDASTVKVAVLDTGVDLTHPDLKGRVSVYDHQGETATDIVGHGTHVSGIVAADNDNNVGIAGICSCDLSVYKIFPDDPAADGGDYVDETAYLRALNACRTAGVRVVNLSIGGTRRDQTEELVFRLLTDSGTLVVAAMGNEYEEGDPVEYPAAYDHVLAVGAINESNRRAYFSNTGPHIGLSAPGMNILSTLPLKTSRTRGKEDTEYAAWSGTSMATPHVTAAAALLFARNPGWDGDQVAKRLEATAAKLPQMVGKPRTSSLGAGLLDLQAALS